MNLVKTKSGYIPATDSDKEKSDKIGIGEVVQAKSVDMRNYKFLQKFFALIRVVHQNLPERYDNHFPTPEHLRKELIKRAGFYDTYTDLKGVTQYIPQSIAFNSMSSEEFEQLYSKVLDVVIQWFDFDREVLESEIVTFC